MSDGTQTPIMVLAVGFFFPPSILFALSGTFFEDLSKTVIRFLESQHQNDKINK